MIGIYKASPLGRAGNRPYRYIYRLARVSLFDDSAILSYPGKFQVYRPLGDVDLYIAICSILHCAYLVVVRIVAAQSDDTGFDCDSFVIANIGTFNAAVALAGQGQGEVVLANLIRRLRRARQLHNLGAIVHAVLSGNAGDGDRLGCDGASASLGQGDFPFGQLCAVIAVVAPLDIRAGQGQDQGDVLVFAGVFVGVGAGGARDGNFITGTSSDGDIKIISYISVTVVGLVYSSSTPVSCNTFALIVTCALAI